jgi:hypothetical protein
MPLLHAEVVSRILYLTICIVCVHTQQLADAAYIRVYTGRFIMHSGITKIYYRKIVGHVFTKPVQIEGTTQKFVFPVSCFS